ncbi:DUF397 domain-containing protein [Streptomyces sp. NPDC006997]|uniref:DUF397 domain-containing protein n=1 Tax=Streptomyces sp. NPDC006997 TaxID=3155356 RepID=UPI0033D5D155
MPSSTSCANYKDENTLTELKWIKSSHSEASGNNCVEVAAVEDAIVVRDSKFPTRNLTIRPQAFTMLIQSVTAGPLGPK